MSSTSLLPLLLLSLFGCMFIDVSGQQLLPVCSLQNQGTPTALYNLLGVNGQTIGISELSGSPYSRITFNLCKATGTGCTGFVCGTRTTGGVDVLCAPNQQPVGNFLNVSSPQAGAKFTCGTGAITVEGIVASDTLQRLPLVGASFSLKTA